MAMVVEALGRRELKSKATAALPPPAAGLVTRSELNRGPVEDKRATRVGSWRKMTMLRRRRSAVRGVQQAGLAGLLDAGLVAATAQSSA